MRQQSWTFACLPFANEGNPRSDNGPEFVAEAVQAWIERGSPWENGYIESFNAACAMSCSTARSSIPSEKLRSSSKAGGAITVRSGRMPHSATSHQHQRCS